MIDLDLTAKFIANHEGFVDHVYADPGSGRATIGYGETDPDIIAQYRDRTMTKAAALELLKKRLQGFADGVEHCVKPTAMTQNQHEAFTSLAYNIGLGAFCGSTACRRFKDGDLAGTATAMAWFTEDNGRVLPGLVTRRADEVALFNGTSAPADPPNLMAYGPAGTHVDVVIHGTDNRPYRASAESPAALQNAQWTPLGGPEAAVCNILHQGWLADGSDFVVIATGSDDRPYYWSDNINAWVPIRTGTVGTNE
jgi:lysozyme